MKNELETNGFQIIPGLITKAEIDALIDAISQADNSNPVFIKSKDLFAIRQFLKYVPQAAEIILNSSLKSYIDKHFGSEYFIVKSIYFDKPPESNWFVSYHQDLTISVKERRNIEGFGPWTVKERQFAVQPSLDILQDNFTVRIHLDNTTKENGALKVIPGSHLKGMYRPESINWDVETEIDCEVPAGGAMFMEPLLLHSSGRTTNGARRRVIHIEFSRCQLPRGLEWAELISEEPSRKYWSDKKKIILRFCH